MLRLMKVLGLIFLTLGLVLQNSYASPFDTYQSSNDVKLSDFKKVYVMPVDTDLVENPRVRRVRDINVDRPVSETDQERKAKDAYEDIVKAFSKREFELADRPGADTLTVEVVLTRLQSTKPTIADFDFQPGLDFIGTTYAGGANFSVQLKQKDTVLAEIVDKYETTFNDGRPRIAVWQDVDRSTKRFARKLANFVQKN